MSTDPSYLPNHTWNPLRSHDFWLCGTFSSEATLGQAYLKCLHFCNLVTLILLPSAQAIILISKWVLLQAKVTMFHWLNSLRVGSNFIKYAVGKHWVANFCSESTDLLIGGGVGWVVSTARNQQLINFGGGGEVTAVRNLQCTNCSTTLLWGGGGVLLVTINLAMKSLWFLTVETLTN